MASYAGLIGNGVGSFGEVVVNSGTWANTYGLYVGWRGNGSLQVNGGYVYSSDGFIGHEVGGIGSAEVSGGIWHVGDTVFLGYEGTGSLRVNGGLVYDRYAYIGHGAGSSGSAVVTSGTWYNFDNLYVGFDGTGNLQVDGGLVDNRHAYIGFRAGSSGSATVTSGTLANFGNLYVGSGGTGNLLVNGGFVMVSGTAYTGNLGTGLGSTHLQSGTLSVQRLAEGSGAGSVFLNGGVLQARVDQGDFLSAYEAGDVTVGFGGAFIDSNGYAIGISTVLSGSGRLTKIGAGTLTLSGSNSYTGGTTVSLGTLVATQANAAGTGTVTVEGGNFHIEAGVDVNNAIVLAGGSFSRQLSGDLAGAVDATSDLAGMDTMARILAGTTGATTLVTAFSRDEGAFSDTYHLEGTGNSAFVLQLSFASLESGLVLGWLDEGEWVRAGEGNADNNATGGMLGFVGSFAGFQAAYGTDLGSYMGAYGAETAEGVTSVWAVLNHNSAFAAIPEPSVLLLLPAGLLVCLSRRRR